MITHQNICIYQKLLTLIPNLTTLKIGNCQKSKIDGYMDLNLDVLRVRDEVIIIALSHYYKQNGDLISDPDMEIKINKQAGFAEALTYQDSFSYQRVYEDGRVNLKLKKKIHE